MSISSLVSYIKISPNKTSPRNHVIDTITIHCMAGNLSVEACGNVFAPSSRQASSNYGVGSDGRIACYVDEDDRSWCSSSPANDYRAITIEVANDGNASTGWHVSDKAMQSLIRLCADICKRNNIKSLKWKNDKSLIGKVDEQNMTVHRWFANKDCPGAYLMSKMGYIADEANKLLDLPGVVTQPSASEHSNPSKTLDEIANEVIAGKWGNGEDRKSKLQAAGYVYEVIQQRVNELYSDSSSTTTKSEPTKPSLKSVDEVANEVIAGKWGNGSERKSKLEAAGYNYSAVQSRVNELYSGVASSKPSLKSIDEIAREVIRGNWGNGSERKNRLQSAGYNYSEVQSRVNALLK